MNIPEPKLDHLYQETILEHNKNPRNFKELESPTLYSHGHNPVCGDDYHLYLNTDTNKVITDIAFHGSGCAISKSCASIMTTLVKGKTLEEAQELEENFSSFMTDKEVSEITKEKVGRLKMFEGVREFPIRIKCATLIWHALKDAIKDSK